MKISSSCVYWMRVAESVNHSYCVIISFVILEMAEIHFSHLLAILSDRSSLDSLLVPMRVNERMNRLLKTKIRSYAFSSSVIVYQNRWSASESVIQSEDSHFKSAILHFVRHFLSEIFFFLNTNT